MMTARAITRRSLLTATAGALAAGLTRPPAVLAALAGPPEPTLEERWVGSLPAAEGAIGLARNADLVGVEWRAPAEARVELRFRGYGGRWSGWVSAGGCACSHGRSPHGTGPHPAGPPDRVLGAPLWTGGTDLVQLRASRAVTGVRLHLVDVSGRLGAHRRAIAAGPFASLAGALPLATPVLAAGPGQPPIIARRAWAQGMSPPGTAPAYGAVKLAFVHHTENPNGYAPAEVAPMLRAIYLFHRQVRGWNDIGYNFVIDLYGRVFEARAGGIHEPVVGAQAGGYNLVSTGVAVLGSFTGTPISPAAAGALEHLLAWKLALHGRPAQGRVTVRVNPAGAPYSRFPANAQVSLPRIAGHRDADSTDCPGDALYGELAVIRRGSERLAGRPARATLALAGPAPLLAGAPRGAARSLQGSLTLLDGTPVPGAPIVVQARGVTKRGQVVQERTIGEAVTDAQGKWSLPASYAAAQKGGMWLRALYAGPPARVPGGVGAAVSEPLRVVAVAPLSPPAAPPPSPPAAAPPAP
jgi:hypothetical protein